MVALLVGLFIVAIGMFGVAAPHGLLTAVGSILTPFGLYLVAALRIVFGVVLVLAAPSSRAPKVLRLLGFIMLVAGLTTPFFGVDRARAMLDWWAARGPAFMRLWAGFAVAFGALSCMRPLLAATLPDTRMRRPQLRRGPQAESETWLQGTTGSGIWGHEEL